MNHFQSVLLSGISSQRERTYPNYRKGVTLTQHRKGETSVLLQSCCDALAFTSHDGGVLVSSRLTLPNVNRIGTDDLLGEHTVS